MLNDENNEHFPEVLRERRRFYRETKKDQDFWVVPNPTFLDAMPDVAKKIRQLLRRGGDHRQGVERLHQAPPDRVYKGAIEGNAEECLASKSLIPKDALPPWTRRSGPRPTTSTRRAGGRRSTRATRTCKLDR